MRYLSPFKKAAIANASLFVVVLFVTSWAANKVQAQVYVRNGLQIYYPFNGSPQDFSGQNNHGLPSNIDYVPDRGGNDSGAAFFNGISGVVASQFPPSVDIDFTVCGWAKPRAMPTGNQLFSMVGIEDFNLYFNAGLAGDSTLGFLFRSAGAYQPFTRSKVTSVYADWFHFTITRSGGVQTQFVNGIPADTQQVATGFVDGTTNSVLIGGSPVLRSSGVVGYFNGLLDDIRLYNRALSQPEIDTLSGRVPLAVKKDWQGLSISRSPNGGVSLYSPEALAEVAFYDLKGSRLSLSSQVASGHTHLFAAPPSVLIRVLDRRGNQYARFIP